MRNDVSGIYVIENRENGKWYIGSAVKLFARRISHFDTLKKGKHHNEYLQHSYNKYGKECFEFQVLEFCDKDELIAREQFYIDKYNPEYNICRIAGNMLGVKRSEESKRIASERTREEYRTGKRVKIFSAMSPETRAKIKEAKRNRSPEAKARTSAILKIVAHPPHDPETVKKRSNKMRANYAALSDDEKRAYVARTKHVYTDEVRKKKSASLRLAWKRRKEAEMAAFYEEFSCV